MTNDLICAGPKFLLHPSAAHKAGCPLCDPTKTVRELNATLTSNPKVLWAKPNDLHTHSPDCRGSGCIDVVAKLDHDRLQIQLRVVSAQRDEYAARLGLGAMPSDETTQCHPDPTGKTREPPHCPSCSCGMPSEEPNELPEALR